MAAEPAITLELESYAVDENSELTRKGSSERIIRVGVKTRRPVEKTMTSCSRSTPTEVTRTSQSLLRRADHVMFGMMGEI